MKYAFTWLNTERSRHSYITTTPFTKNFVGLYSNTVVRNIILIHVSFHIQFVQSQCLKHAVKHWMSSAMIHNKDGISSVSVHSELWQAACVMLHVSFRFSRRTEFYKDTKTSKLNIEYSFLSCYLKVCIPIYLFWNNPFFFPPCTSSWYVSFTSDCIMLHTFSKGISFSVYTRMIDTITRANNFLQQITGYKILHKWCVGIQWLGKKIK